MKIKSITALNKTTKLRCRRGELGKKVDIPKIRAPDTT
jgi:hypothetical protein